MKKIATFIVMALVCLSSFAQTKREGRFGTEILFTPWNGNHNFTFVDGIKLRFFISDNFAIRTTLNFSTNPETDYTYTGANLEIENKMKSNWSTFGINPGVEYHFGNYERLSLYAGAELRFAAGIASAIQTNSANDNKTEWIGHNPNGQVNQTTLGLGVFTGADYYILSRLYIGAEFGLRFTTNASGEYSTKVTVGGTTVENKVKDYRKEANLNFICTPSIRLGWNF